MIYPTPRIGFNHSFKATTLTSSTGRHTPVIDLGGLCLTSIQMSTVGWTDADISIHGSVNSSSTARQLPVWGSTAAGSVGSTNPQAASYETTDNRIISVDPRLTQGLQYVMLKSSATQATTRALVLGLSPI